MRTMDFSLSLDIKPIDQPITYKGSVLLIGSCFTEHISDRLAQHRLPVCSNPHGILFNPLSVADSLERYVSGHCYTENDLFLLHELWHSWEHHSRFSDIDKNAALQKMNGALAEAHEVVKNATHVIITLGSSFQYYLKESNQPVANNHRAPGQWFEKRLLETDLIYERLKRSMERIIAINTGVQFIFTISPVRHIRDGVVANNRSKARLLEAVHRICDAYENAYYFPAYELVIDILRDYRFYDIDFVHPNYMATQYVWEQFVAACIDEPSRQIMSRVAAITTALKHRPRFPNTQAHTQFLKEQAERTKQLLQEYPYLDLEDALRYFNQVGSSIKE